VITVTRQVLDRPASGDEKDRHPTHGELLCPQCGVAHLSTRQCKRVCEQCGYVESCEDNFVPNLANPRENHTAMDAPKSGP